MKITVAIPTIAGRADYLASALTTCTSQQDANLEILVSDNSPGDAEAITRGSGDPRVRYIRPPHYLTMAAHWEFLLGHVTGDSLTIIGDDDGLMPNAITAVSGLLQQHGNVPIHHSLCNYYWPDHPRRHLRNSVVFFHGAFAGGRWVDSETYLNGVARGRERYLDGPMIYHNFIPMPLVRQIAGSGPFFRRAIPDVYSALAIAANSRRFYSSGQYLTVAGVGAQSNGAQVLEGADGTTFNTGKEPSWHVPRTKSRAISLMLLDALTEVAEHFERPDLLAAVHYPPHLEDALSYAFAMKGLTAKWRETRIVTEMAIAHGAALPVASWLICRAPFKLARALGFIRRPVQSLGLGPHVRNIAEATVEIDRLGVR